MTRFVLSFTLFGLFLFPSLSAQFTTDDPVEYSNYIVREQEKVGQLFIDFSQQLLNSDDYKANEKKRAEVVEHIELGLRRLRNMAPFRGGKELRSEAIAVFELYKELHTNEFAKVTVLLANKNASTQALEDYFAMQIEAEKKMAKNSARMRKAQKDFAERYQLAIVPNPMQETFDRIMAANIYSREVFLEYLRVDKYNEAWWEAMQVRDTEAMKKSRADVINAVSASTLKNMPELQGNGDFRDIALERINYYAALASREYKEVEESLAKEQLSQEDVDYVNGVIERFNEENTRLNNLFNQRQSELRQRSLTPAE